MTCSHLLYFPGRNPIPSTTVAAVSSHGGLAAHVTPRTSRGFSLAPSGFLLSSLPMLVILRWERSPKLIGGGPQELWWELCRLESHLVTAALGHQGPCWESRVFSSHLRRSRQGGEWRVCACFPTASPTRDAREECPCWSQPSLSRTTRMALFCRHTGHVPYPLERCCWAVYAKVHHLLPTSNRKEASAGTANMTQLQTDR